MPATARNEREPSSAGAAFLLRSPEPAIRRLARRELVGEAQADEDVLAGPMVMALLSGRGPDGGFGNHPYSKWMGAHWRLVSLVELGVPAGEPRALAAVETVLEWLGRRSHLDGIRRINGLVRVHASQEGNALAVCCRLGLAGDPRVRRLATSLIDWQWPDGGWNCDVRPGAGRSSFHESLAPAWGLHEYASATGDPDAASAAARAAELFLSHRLYRSLRTGEPINRTWLALHYPPYWHFDVLQGLLILTRLGHARDPRMADALDLVERRRRPDGTWRPGGYWWNRQPSNRLPDVVDWGRSGPNEMLTLNALRVLAAARRPG